MANYEIILSLINKDIEHFSKINKKDIKLVIVTKAQKVDSINNLIDLGYRTFGENYVQEAIEKIKTIKLISRNFYKITITQLLHY